jgi:hypothetical protein
MLTFIGTSGGEAACKSYVPIVRTIQGERKEKTQIDGHETIQPKAAH